MTFELDLTTSADAEIVLGAIRTEAGYWRESQLPADLRRMGAFGVQVRVTGHHFVLSLEDASRDPPASEFLLRGEVTALPGGGSRVRATPAYRSREWVSFALFAALPISVIIGGQWIVGSLVLMLISGIYWYRVRRHALLARDADPGVAHLVERLEVALAFANSHVARGAI